MKLNMDCFNAILLYLQDQLNVNERGQMSYITISTILNVLTPDYSPEDIWYSIRQLRDMKYIKTDSELNTIAQIYDITFAGHQYLSTL